MFYRLLMPIRRGWMMWNFLISGLSLGCTLVLYDGSPLRDPAYLWRLVDDLGITIFGTSAKYIDQLSVSRFRLLCKPRSAVSLIVTCRRVTNQENTISSQHSVTSIPQAHHLPLRYMIMYTSIFTLVFYWALSQVFNYL